MPLKIRCPHCRKVLLAEQDTAGEERLCPACGNPLSVPVLIHDADIAADAGPTEVAARCAHCGHGMAPGTTFCPKCLREVDTGRRLPLGRRLRLISARKWVAGLLLIVGVPLAAFVGFNLFLDWRTARRPTGEFTPVTASVLPTRDRAAELLQADAPAGRIAALASLDRLGRLAAADLATELEASLRGSESRTARQVRNQRAAVLWLGRFGDAACLPVLAEASERKGLRNDALWSRVVLGDASAVAPLCDYWLVQSRRTLFLARAIEQMGADAHPAATAYLKRIRGEQRRTRLALRRAGVAALTRLAASYWECLAWLGQERLDVDLFGAELYELAKPVDEGAIDVSEAVRGMRSARDALESVGHDGTPSSRAACALLLAKFAPQYKSARGRVVAGLAKSIPACTPLEQQRIVWALSQLSGRQFDAPGATRQAPRGPEGVDRDIVIAAVRWARSAGVANPPDVRTPRPAYPRPPRLSRLVVPRRRQAERDLLIQISHGWKSARLAVDSWLDYGIGCTPHLAELLNPGQRDPQLHSVMAAMLITAECDAVEQREMLKIWQDASDQPAWVRGLARTVLASMQSRRRGDLGDWPDGLDLSSLRTQGRAGPSWNDFGRVIAAGGQRMIERLTDPSRTSLPPEQRARLESAARRAAQNRGNNERRRGAP